MNGPGSGGTAEHDARGPRRVAPRAAQARARQPRLRRRRGRVRGARADWSAHSRSRRSTSSCTTCARPPSAAVEWTHERANGRIRNYRPPLRIDASYAATAWTRAVEDEHRLLSQLLAILYAFPRCPQDALTPRLQRLAEPFPLVRRGAADADGGADFWSAVGGVYKASIDFVVTSPASRAEPRARARGAHADAAHGDPRNGPAARSSRAIASAARSPTRTARPSRPPGSCCPSRAARTSSDAEGRFRFDRVRPGHHALRRPHGRRRGGEGELVVPARASTSSSAVPGSAAGDRWGSPVARIGWRALIAASRRSLPACPRRRTPGRASCSVISSRWCASA